MEMTYTKVPTGWRWEIDDDDAVYSGVCATKVEAVAEALACWSSVLYAEVNGGSPAPDPQPDWRTRAEAAEQRAEAAEVALAQAHADRTLLIGLWLATVPPDVLPTLLPADPGDLDRLVAALDAVNLQSGTESHTAAVRAIIARIVRVAPAAGGAR